MIVYRVEYAHKGKTYGPYVASIHTDCDAVKRACNYFKNNVMMMPEPHDDGIAFIPYSHVCGCLTAADMFQWVERWSMIRLLDAGFTISMYDVDEERLLIGGVQVCFSRDSAILIGHLTCDELHNKLEEEFMGA